MRYTTCLCKLKFDLKIVTRLENIYKRQANFMNVFIKSKRTSLSVSDHPTKSRSQNSDSRSDTATATLFYLRRYDLPDKGPWPYRKSRRLSDRTRKGERRWTEQKKKEERSVQGQEEKRGEHSRPATFDSLLETTW